MTENISNQNTLKTLSLDKSSHYKKKSNLRQLQLKILNSLTKDPIIKIKKRPSRKLTLNSKIDDYELYDNKINNTLKNYQVSIIHDKD